MKPKTKKSDQEENGWLMLIQSFVENAIGQIGNNIKEKVDVWTDDLKIKAISSIFLIIGMVFFLLGLAFYINTLTGEQMQWIGFFLAGSIAILAGLLIGRK